MGAVGAVGPHLGSAEGQRPSHIRGMQGPCPCSSSPGETQSPLHLYPESPQKLHPNVQLNAPAPRINSRIFFLVKAKGNNKDRFAHHLKVANRSFVVAESPIEGVRLAAGGAKRPPQGVQGASPLTRLW